MVSTDATLSFTSRSLKSLYEVKSFFFGKVFNTFLLGEGGGVKHFYLPTFRTLPK